MADLGFDGKVAIITGAGGGLGREHALLLASPAARRSWSTTSAASVSGEGGDEGPAHTTAKEIEDLGGVAVADTNSVATPEGGEAIVQTALDAFGRVDIVINNAGILRDKTFHNMTPDLVDPVIDVHLKGAFYVTRPAWIKMREQGYGRIVNTSSNSGILGNFGQTNYGAAKMGLVGFTRVLAAEGAKYNIKANAIAPVARTRMTEEHPRRRSPTSSTRSWCRPSSPGWPTRTARSPARSTAPPAAASPASSSASPRATTTRSSPSRTCATTSRRSATRTATSSRTVRARSSPPS